MDQSILTSTKKILGLSEDYTAYDLDVLTWINSAFSTLRDLGLGQPGFQVSNEQQTWSMFEEDLEIQGFIRTYIYLRVRVMFDPPATQFVMTAMQEQIREHEFRLGVYRENRDYRAPEPATREVDQ